MSSLKDLSEVLTVAKDCFLSQDEDKLLDALNFLDGFISNLKIAVFVVVTTKFDHETEQAIQILDWATKKPLYSQSYSDDSDGAIYLNYLPSNLEEDLHLNLVIFYGEAHPYYQNYQKGAAAKLEKINKELSNIKVNKNTLFELLKQDLEKFGYLVIMKDNASYGDLNLYSSSME